MLVLNPVCGIVIGIYLMLAGQIEGAWILLIVGSLTALVTAAFTLPCRYTLLEDSLSIRCGLICYQISLRSIVDVSPSNTIMSGPALSMKRILITTQDRKYVVSPKLHDQFIADLRQTVTHVKSKD